MEDLGKSPAFSRQKIQGDVGERAFSEVEWSERTRVSPAGAAGYYCFVGRSGTEEKETRG